MKGLLFRWKMPKINSMIPKPVRSLKTASFHPRVGGEEGGGGGGKGCAPMF